MVPLVEAISRICIHRLTQDSGGQPTPVTLGRKLLFPAPVKRKEKPPPPVHLGDLSPRHLGNSWLELEARVVMDQTSRSTGKDQYLGFGRSGCVYALDVISVRDAASSQEVDLKLPPLCMKVPQPTYARSLVREAWFYEQFDAANLAGVVVPGCLGVFRSSLSTEGDGQPLTIIVPSDRNSEEELEKRLGLLQRGCKSFTAPLSEEVHNMC